MKKKIIEIVAILIIGGILCTTDLSLRTAVFIVSPHSAVTMEYEHYKTESKWCELYKITKNPLVIWAVYRIGPLHYSKYFGWA